MRELLSVCLSIFHTTGSIIGTQDLDIGKFLGIETDRQTEGKKEHARMIMRQTNQINPG